jgi:hypothetical protein
LSELLGSRELNLRGRNEAVSWEKFSLSPFPGEVRLPPDARRWLRVDVLDTPGAVHPWIDDERP